MNNTKAIKWLENVLFAQGKPSGNLAPAMIGFKEDPVHEYTHDAAVWCADGEAVRIRPGSKERFDFPVPYGWTLEGDADYGQ